MIAIAPIDPRIDSTAAAGGVSRSTRRAPISGECARRPRRRQGTREWREVGTESVAVAILRRYECGQGCRVGSSGDPHPSGG